MSRSVATGVDPFTGCWAVRWTGTRISKPSLERSWYHLDNDFFVRVPAQHFTGSALYRSMRQTILRPTLMALTLASVALLEAPVRAALPPLSCGTYDIPHRYGGTEKLGFCVSFEYEQIFAGMKNLASGRHYFLETARVELVYYAFDQFPNGGNLVLEKSGDYSMLYRNEVVQTPRRSGFWNPGVYCARIYEKEFHRWADLHCVDTNGHVHR